MYESFTVKNYRGFREVTISNLKRINLIAGMNNSGKTSLLEALFIHAGKNNPDLLLRVNAFRGMDTLKIDLSNWSEMPWESLFHNRDISKPIEFNATLDSKVRSQLISTKTPRDSYELDTSTSRNKSKYFDSTFDHSSSTIASPIPNTKVLQLEEHTGKKSSRNTLTFTPQGVHLDKTPSPDFPGYFIYSRKMPSNKEDAELFGKLDILGETETLVDILKIIEPRLKRLTTVYVNDVPTIHGDIGLEKLLPLTHMGEGISRLASFLLRISNCKDGVVFIDEIENGFHYSVLGGIWKAIFHISKEYNVQVFATTHSYECAKSANNAFSGDKNYDFAYYRLDRLDDVIIVNSYDNDTLNYAFKTDIEVR